MYASDSSAGVRKFVHAREVGGIAGVHMFVHARGTTCPELGSGANYHWRTVAAPASASAVTAGVHIWLYARSNLPQNYF